VWVVAETIILGWCCLQVGLGLAILGWRYFLLGSITLFLLGWWFYSTLPV
jgi:hypothetical protein